MKYISSLKKLFFRFINTPDKLFYLYLAVLMLTNIVLLFTEKMGIMAKFAFILIPLGVQMGLLSLFKNSGKIFLYLIPKSIIDAFQLVLIALFGGSFIAVDMFLNLTTTSSSEAGELLLSLLPIIIFILIVYIPMISLSIYSIVRRNELSRTFRVKHGKISLLLMALGAAFFMGAKFIENSSFNFKHHIYPINTLYNAKFALAKLGRIDNFLTTSKGFKFGSTHAALSTDSLKREREVYVLILGETARATNWHLYGYERNTTPNVDTLTNLVKYSDVLTQSNTTHKIVPLVLSGAEAKNYEFIYKSKSVVSAFKEAGFKTIFITNQEYNLGFAKYYFNEADVKISVAKDGVNGLDHNILSYFYEELSNNREENLFFILHLYGSHFNYSERYSSAFREYLPDEVGSISGKYKTNLINSYDNSIRYTDEFIYNVIKRVERENVVSTVLYLSDHGEDLLDDKREKFLHASPLPTFYQLHIPYIVWLSNKYIDLKPNKSNSIVENRDIPISNNTVFHSLLDMASIYTPYLDLTLSIASDSLKRVGREYLTDHDDCIKIINIPFNKYDLEQFRKRSIIFE